MQSRHNNRVMYFKELALTCTNYFIPYIQRFQAVNPSQRVLEVGCGEGGNLLPFARMGCSVTGVDLAECRIDEARTFFAAQHVQGTFFVADILDKPELGGRFDIIICHDVWEHIADKSRLLACLAEYLCPHGVLFISFPAWQMPFGGHQQICRSRLLSHLPFFHLLPVSAYRALLSTFGEKENCKGELFSIRRTKASVESFERLFYSHSALRILDRTLWLINPHYKVKFCLTPRRLSALISHIPVVRNFFSTSCWYIVGSH